MANENILVIEDEKNIGELLKYNLESHHYNVLWAHDGEAGLTYAREKDVDLILLDLMLPKIDGIEICKILKQNRKTTHLPVIMLTAKGEEMDKILGLELGADDYVTKPFSPRELLARIKAVLKRCHSSSSGVKDIYEVGLLLLDIEKHLVLLDGDRLNLTSKEYDLLKVLIEANGRALTRDYLLDKVWGYENASRIETRTVDMHIGQLRKKIASEASRIETVKNVGYRLEQDGE